MHQVDRAVEEWNNWTTQENLLCCVVARPRWFKVSLEMNYQWLDSNYKSPCQKQPLSQPCHNPAPQIVFGKTLWASFRTGKIALTFTREETYVGYDVTGTRNWVVLFGCFVVAASHVDGVPHFHFPSQKINFLRSNFQRRCQVIDRWQFAQEK